MCTNKVIYEKNYFRIFKFCQNETRKPGKRSLKLVRLNTESLNSHNESVPMFFIFNHLRLNSEICHIQTLKHMVSS